MADKKYLITAATGATGREALAALLATGQEVRAFVHREDERSEALRRQGAEIVIGDLNDFQTVKSALKGVHRAYFCYPIAPGLVQATAQFAQASQEAGVEALVNMSQITARESAVSHAAFQHWLGERVFDWSGVPVTHIRPTFFAENLLAFAPMIQRGKFLTPFGLGKHAPVTSEDQGRLIAAILQNPEAHKGQTYPLYGPVEYTSAETAAVLGRVLGKEVTYEPVPFDVMRAFLLASAGNIARNDARSGYSESNIPDSSGESFLTQHLGQTVTDHNNGVFSGTNDVIERITGKPPLSLEEFVFKHIEAFTPSSSDGKTESAS